MTDLILDLKALGDLVIQARAKSLLPTQIADQFIDQISENKFWLYKEIKKNFWQHEVNSFHSPLFWYNLKGTNLKSIGEGFQYLYELKKKDTIGFVDSSKSKDWLLKLFLNNVVYFPKTDNIYQDLRRHWESKIGLELSDYTDPMQDTSSNIVMIFPDSRVKNKEMLQLHIDKYCSAIKKYGLMPVVASFHLNKYKKIDKFIHLDGSFHSTKKLILKSRFVVSADSFTSHLSEFLGRQVIISLNKVNHYWLPPFAFKKKRFTLNECEKEINEVIFNVLHHR
jgi:ADP-heptose:LPS heptosyltransferase